MRTRRPAPRTLAVAAALTAAGLALYACADTTPATAPGAALDRGDAADDSADERELDAGGRWTGLHRRYGRAERLGEGRARTYVLFDKRRGTQVPVEVGVALDERALQGLPAPMPMPHPMPPGDGHEHVDSHIYDLALPARHGTPYQFVELDWNPAGHEVKGVYDVPHFDFHFYTVTPAERAAVDPADPQFQQRADNLPAAEFVPAPYSTLTPPGAPTPAVPRMGVHWIDPRSPEIQGLLGRPELARPFTTTFIHGSWDGRFTFAEPMITRAFILGRKARRRTRSATR
jgi:hypothetical protein